MSYVNLNTYKILLSFFFFQTAKIASKVKVRVICTLKRQTTPILPPMWIVDQRQHQQRVIFLPQTVALPRWIEFDCIEEEASPNTNWYSLELVLAALRTYHAHRITQHNDSENKWKYCINYLSKCNVEAESVFSLWFIFNFPEEILDSNVEF